MIDINNHLAYLDGDSWKMVAGDFKDVAVGNEFVWALKPNGDIYRTRDVWSVGWERVEGNKKQIDSTDEGFVWGLSSSGSM